MSENKRIVIGIMGEAGAGKDTAFNVFKNSELLSFNRLAFGDKIKNELAAVYNLDYSFFDNRDTKEVETQRLSLQYCKDHKFVKMMLDAHPIDDCTALSPRFVMQQWGTEYKRSKDDLYFVRDIEDAIEDNPNKNYIITDVRHELEIECVNRAGGNLIRVDMYRDGRRIFMSKNGQNQAVSQHDSERLAIEEGIPGVHIIKNIWGDFDAIEREVCQYIKNEYNIDLYRTKRLSFA